MNIIYNLNEYLHKTLKTYDINITVNKVKSEINLQRINADIKIEDNKILIKINDIMYNHTFGLCLDVINVMMINWFGWFPTQMNMINWLNQENIKMYNRETLIEEYKDLKSVEIMYEGKCDLESKIHDKFTPSDITL